MMKWLVAILALLWPLASHAEQYNDASRWRWEWSPGMPAHPLQSKQGMVFVFPRYNGPEPCANDQACASAHYLTTVPLRSLAGAKSITVVGRFIFSGQVRLGWKTEPANHGTEPAAFHLYFQRRGDNWSGSGPFEFYRWWSNPGKVVIKNGNFWLNVPLVMSRWSSVQGDKDTPAALAGFSGALTNTGRIGMTFGGGWFFGHGLYARGSGSVTAVITRFVVNR